MNPCRNCESRHQGCHSNCPEYDKFKAVIEKAREARKRELEVENFLLRPVPSKHNRKVKERK